MTSPPSDERQEATCGTRIAADLRTIANEVRAIPEQADKLKAARLAAAGIDGIASRIGGEHTLADQTRGDG